MVVVGVTETVTSPQPGQMEPLGTTSLVSPISCDLPLDAGDGADLGGVKHPLITQLMLHPGKLAVDVVPQLAHLAHGKGVGVAQLDLSLQLGDPCALRGLVAVDGHGLAGSVGSGCAVGHAAQNAAQAAVENAQRSAGDAETQASPGDASGVVVSLDFHGVNLHNLFRFFSRCLNFTTKPPHENAAFAPRLRHKKKPPTIPVGGFPHLLSPGRETTLHREGVVGIPDFAATSINSTG